MDDKNLSAEISKELELNDVERVQFQEMVVDYLICLSVEGLRSDGNSSHMEEELEQDSVEGGRSYEEALETCSPNVRNAMIKYLEALAADLAPQP